jgi:hypothetical protein
MIIMRGVMTVAVSRVVIRGAWPNYCNTFHRLVVLPRAAWRYKLPVWQIIPRFLQWSEERQHEVKDLPLEILVFLKQGERKMNNASDSFRSFENEILILCVYFINFIQITN